VAAAAAISLAKHGSNQRNINRQQSNKRNSGIKAAKMEGVSENGSSYVKRSAISVAKMT